MGYDDQTLRHYQKHPSEPNNSDNTFSECLCGFNKIYHYTETCDHMYCTCFYHRTQNECKLCGEAYPTSNPEKIGRNNISNAFYNKHPVEIYNGILENEQLYRHSIINNFDEYIDKLKINLEMSQYDFIQIVTFIPIKNVLIGFCENKILCQNTSDNTNTKRIINNYKHILCVQKIKNRWVVSNNHYIHFINNKKHHQYDDCHFL
jgi:hypothetical protein